jgi:hypothetical protein
MEFVSFGHIFNAFGKKIRGKKIRGCTGGEFAEGV